MSTPSTPFPSTAGDQEIRALSVLPARRQDIELHTADGLTLVGELALPPDGPPAATLITLHPLPTHGGFMDSHVLRKAAWRLPALADLAVLRFGGGVGSRRLLVGDGACGGLRLGDRRCDGEAEQEDGGRHCSSTLHDSRGPLP